MIRTFLSIRMELKEPITIYCNLTFSMKVLYHFILSSLLYLSERTFYFGVLQYTKVKSME